MRDADTCAEGGALLAAPRRQEDKFDALSEQTLAILRAGNPHLFGRISAKGLKARTTRKQKTPSRDFARLGHDLRALFPDGHQRDLIAASWGNRLAEAKMAGELEPEIASLLENEFDGVLGDDGGCCVWPDSYGNVSANPIRWDRWHKDHAVIPLRCTRCETDRRGELGIVGRFDCYGDTRFAVWLWRDVGLGCGPLIRAQQPWPDVHLAPRCRKCGGTPRMNLRTLVAKLSEPAWQHAELLIDPDGRFVVPASRVPRLGRRPFLAPRA